MRLFEKMLSIAGSPLPIRARLVRKFLRIFPHGSFSSRLRAGGFDRPYYAFCLYNAAQEAKALGHKAFTAIEFGVAGGNGLILLCKYRDEIERETGMKIHLLGLDAGSGLPNSTDSRDLLYLWPVGSYEMDIPKLQGRLAGKAQVILGNVSVTTRELVIPADAPLGAVLFDLDYYSSTRDALAIFDQENVLPRVWCYFDDVQGEATSCTSESTGERAAIKEFNGKTSPLQSHLSQAYVFKYSAPEPWHQHIYVYHRMTHPDYNRCLSDHKHTLSID